MNEIIERHRQEIAEICRRHHVRRLDVFGSAASDRFDPSRSDVDFVVEFEDLRPEAYAEAWFGLLQELEDLLGRSVDLVTYRYIQNPYFKESVDHTRINLYAA
jgi:predicted nucleotidyltransferase